MRRLADVSGRGFSSLRRSFTILSGRSSRIALTLTRAQRTAYKRRSTRRGTFRATFTTANSEMSASASRTLAISTRRL